MKRYFIWKDGKFNGDKTEWQEISGQEFYDFVNDSQNADRHFIHQLDPTDPEADEVYYEATEETYKRWDRKRKKEEYVLQVKKENPVEIVSLDTILYYDDDGFPVTLGDTIPAPEPDPLIEDLYEALNTLSDKERALIDLLFFNNDGKSDRQISRELGMPQKSLFNKKQKILAKLRCSLAQNRFFSPNKRMRGQVGETSSVTNIHN